MKISINVKELAQRIHEIYPEMNSENQDSGVLLDVLDEQFNLETLILEELDKLTAKKHEF